MAKRKIEIFVEIQNDKEFHHIVDSNADKLICAEIYSTYFGSCTCLDKLFTTIKLDWSSGMLILLKVPCDSIECLQRFRDHSEPVYMFITRKKVTKVFRGVDSIKLAAVAKIELSHYNREMQGQEPQRQFYELAEATPDENTWISTITMEKNMEKQSLQMRRRSRQAERKRHRAMLMVPYLKHLNFVVFWPHAHHAHPELYEKWAENNIFMVGREEYELDREKAEDILYAGDAPMNEASMHQLLSGPVLALCFRCLDEDKNFVSLVRTILYEDRIQFEDQGMPQSAFDHYKTYSKTKEEILQHRREEREKKKQEEIEKRARRLSEMQRLARQARHEAIEAKRAEKEQLKIELLKTGRLAELDHLKEEPDDDEDVELSIPIPEELPEDCEEETIEEDEDEYFPPAGLIIPGFYAPPNDIAKVNGLAILFSKSVLECVTPQPEYLPQHLLVMLDISKRYEAIQAMKRHKKLVIHMGIFKATTPYKAVHIAYSVKQFDALGTNVESDKLKLAFMISLEVDIAVLELMDLSPSHVSRDPTRGEDECAALFPVDYGDHQPEFVDFDDEQI
ncbi:uncharacterized protein LOC128677668 isoform X2 [Plodia interpunctella]|uniref:uncharacterized protein LOC128677668 isoform X2 n=1 Tax=Plodia interpunctella TaxID=58824 RepID=UPI0023679B22|nr:uncharacterized protein LOC128677668 isoform X8 [Plodia interpunctella]XP_053614657.1 uncharacterized protein LOC128677668 isoform X8 [Plodia interpunctella]